MMLEIHSFAVETAESGETALALLAGQGDGGSDVILLDLQMPGLSGAELIAVLRTTTAARIFTMSGSDPGEALRGVADGFLLKPVEMQGLITLLQPDAVLEVAVETDLQATPVCEEAVVDPAVLGKLKGMMSPAAVREIYEAVAVDLKGRLVILASAMADEDLDQVHRLAHSIKGGCSMVGLTAATAAASRLEFSNATETYPDELLQLKDALLALEGILGDNFPA